MIVTRRLRRLVRAGAVVALLAGALFGSHVPAALARSAHAAVFGPLIPFEIERAAARGDRHVLRLNEDSSAIPANRIVDLPVVDGKMGDYARLDGGLLLYFPYGSIVSAESDFREFRPDPAHPGQWLRDPSFALTHRFDRELGPVCDKEGDPAAPEGRLAFRMRRGGLYSLVTEKILPATAGRPASTTYRVVSVADLQRLLQAPRGAKLIHGCRAVPLRLYRRPQPRAR